MDAHEQKVKLLIIQRRFLEACIENTTKTQDGDPSVKYVGYIYPENIEYLESLEYNVTIVDNPYIVGTTGGRKVYLIEPKEIYGSVHISEEELTKSEKYADEFKQMMDSLYNS